MIISELAFISGIIMIIGGLDKIDYKIFTQNEAYILAFMGLICIITAMIITVCLTIFNDGNTQKAKEHI